MSPEMRSTLDASPAETMSGDLEHPARAATIVAAMTPTDIGKPDYFHKVVDCQWACPAHTPVPEYIRLIAAGHVFRSDWGPANAVGPAFCRSSGGGAGEGLGSLVRKSGPTPTRAAAGGNDGAVFGEPDRPGMLLTCSAFSAHASPSWSRPSSA